MKRIPKNKEEINLEDATIESEEMPHFLTPNSIIDIEKVFTAYEKLTYLILCRYGNRGRVAFPSYNTIARKGEFSRDTAKRAIKGLMKKGCIIKQNTQSEKGGYTSNNYKVIYNLDALGAMSTQASGYEHPGLDAVSTSRKKHDYKEIMREGAHSLDNKEQALKAIVEYFNQVYEEEYKRKPTIKKSHLKTLGALIGKHGADMIADCLTLHVKEPDHWTLERVSNMGTFEHNLDNYMDKVNKRQLMEARKQQEREYLNQLREEERLRDEQIARERAEFDALPAEEQQRRNEAKQKMFDDMRMKAQK